MYRAMYVALLGIVPATVAFAGERNYTLRGDGWFDGNNARFGRLPMREVRMTVRDNGEFAVTLFVRNERYLVRGRWDRGGRGNVERIDLDPGVWSPRLGTWHAAVRAAMTRRSASSSRGGPQMVRSAPRSLRTAALGGATRAIATSATAPTIAVGVMAGGTATIVTIATDGSGRSSPTIAAMVDCVRTWVPTSRSIACAYAWRPTGARGSALEGRRQSVQLRGTWRADGRDVRIDLDAINEMRANGRLTLERSGTRVERLQGNGRTDRGRFDVRFGR
ncbi:MAG: hypothetical protein IPK85_05800 [Gemmatimonadetes bacterium]|nr:hypothetical protein [Gemmatimonadota bacterium]